MRCACAACTAKVPQPFIPWPEPEDEAPAALASKASAHEDDAHFLAWHARDPNLLLHKALYFALCAALAAYVPYLVQWMRTIGLSPLQAGSIFAIGQLTGMVGSPLLARLADSSEAHRRALLLCQRLRRRYAPLWLQWPGGASVCHALLAPAP